MQTQHYTNGVTPPPPPSGGSVSSHPTKRRKRAPKKAPLQAAVQDLAWFWKLLAGLGGAALFLLSIAALGWASKALYEDRAPATVVQQLSDLTLTVKGQGALLQQIRDDISNLQLILTNR